MGHHGSRHCLENRGDQSAEGPAEVVVTNDLPHALAQRPAMRGSWSSPWRGPGNLRGQGFKASQSSFTPRGSLPGVSDRSAYGISGRPPAASWVGLPLARLLDSPVSPVWTSDDAVHQVDRQTRGSAR